MTPHCGLDEAAYGGDGLSSAHVMQTDWDVIVVGAGPAGSVASALLAARGQRVLLVERSRWPRDKTCGGCLNALAVGLLQRIGLGGALRGGAGIERALWRVGRRSLVMDVPGGVAVDRAQFDAALVGEAMNRGCAFRSGVSARLLPTSDSGLRRVALGLGERMQVVRAGVVLACDGINGTLLKEEPWAAWRVGGRSWIGVGTTGAGDLPAGTIRMDVGRGGYVGRVRLGDGRVHLAAALDPAACRGSGGPERLIRRILSPDDRHVMEGERHFIATGRLTRRRRRLGDKRVLAVGDACGYVEPFTGEGMAWAILGAMEAAGLLAEGWTTELPRRWKRRHRRRIERRQRWCRWLRPMMHHPPLAGMGMALGRAIPAAGAYLSRATVGGLVEAAAGLATPPTGEGAG